MSLDNIDDVIRFWILSELPWKEIFVKVLVAELIQIDVDIKIAFIWTGQINAVLKIDPITIRVNTCANLIGAKPGILGITVVDPIKLELPEVF